MIALGHYHQKGFTRIRDPGVSQRVRRLATGHCAPATPPRPAYGTAHPGIAADQRRVRGESFKGSSMTGPEPVDLSPNQNNAFSYRIQLHFPSCPVMHQALRFIHRCTFSDTGLASCEYEAALDNRLQRFFCVRSIAPPLWVELCVGIFGCTGSRIRHANPHGSAHPNWRSGGGINTAYTRVTS